MHAIPRKVLATVAPAVVVLGLGAAIAAQGNSGNVFVTTSAGVVPEGGLFASVQAPYLNAGPRGNAKCSSSSGGLADGEYYFQVTDPSGRMLLSSDAVQDRSFRVAGGRIVSVSNSHGSASGRCSDFLVQLFPFATTPNREGDYKLWIVPANLFDSGRGGAFGFPQKGSSTHSFRLAPPAPADVDSDGDGIMDFYDHCPFVYDPANTCYGG
jgi:hypothetical protein